MPVSPICIFPKTHQRAGWKAFLDFAAEEKAAGHPAIRHWIRKPPTRPPDALKTWLDTKGLEKIPMPESFQYRPAVPISGEGVKLAIAPGVTLWRELFSKAAQKALLDTVFAAIERAPFYRPVMPGSGKEFSVEETNFGPLGWVSDKAGYRYQQTHPVTGAPWPAIPTPLLDLWNDIAGAPPPQCCLVNLYRAGARMGLHQDKDEAALDAPVVSVSLGDDATFRIGSDSKRGGLNQKYSSAIRGCGAIRRRGAARLSRHRS